MIRKIHQKNCTLPMADAGAAASMVNTTQITERMTSIRENFLPAMARAPYSKKDGICTEGAAQGRVTGRVTGTGAIPKRGEDAVVGPTLAEQTRVDDDTLVHRYSDQNGRVRDRELSAIENASDLGNSSEQLA